MKLFWIMRLSIGLLLAVSIFLMDLAYHFSIFSKLKSQDSFRWVKHNLGCTLFVLIFLPMAIEIFTYCFPIDIYENLTIIKIILSIIFIPIAIISSSIKVIQDITTSAHRVILLYSLL